MTAIYEDEEGDWTLREIDGLPEIEHFQRAHSRPRLNGTCLFLPVGLFALLALMSNLQIPFTAKMAPLFAAVWVGAMIWVRIGGKHGTQLKVEDGKLDLLRLDYGRVTRRERVPAELITIRPKIVQVYVRKRSRRRRGVRVKQRDGWCIVASSVRGESELIWASARQQAFETARRFAEALGASFEVDNLMTTEASAASLENVGLKAKPLLVGPLRYPEHGPPTNADFLAIQPVPAHYVSKTTIERDQVSFLTRTTIHPMSGRVTLPSSPEELA